MPTGNTDTPNGNGVGSRTSPLENSAVSRESSADGREKGKASARASAQAKVPEKAKESSWRKSVRQLLPT